MSTKSLVLSVISSLVATAILSIATHCFPPLYRNFQKWAGKKTLNLVSGIALISSGIPMIILSASADAQMFAVTGFIIPFIHSSIHGLTFGQASIFGNFANFFYCTLIIGAIGVVLGVTRIQKFHNLRSPPFRFGY